MPNAFCFLVFCLIFAFQSRIKIFKLLTFYAPETSNSKYRYTQQPAVLYSLSNSETIKSASQSKTNKWLRLLDESANNKATK